MVFGPQKGAKNVKKELKMKVFIASDLHYGVGEKGDGSVRALAKHVCDRGGEDDVLLLGGDLATDDAHIRSCLALFSGFSGKRAAIAGNHDVWMEDGRNSLERYKGLPTLFRAGGFHPLEEEPFIVDGVGFAGTMGWYDLTFRDEGISVPLEAYRKKVYPGPESAVWGDAIHARWGCTDEEVAEWQRSRLEHQLKQLAGTRETIVLTHHVPTKNLLVQPRFLVPKMWRFLNAFLGSERLGETVRRLAPESLVVNGHIHRSGSSRKGPTSFISIGGDYDEKQLVIKEGRNTKRMAFTA
jgi:predicted phosphohydrolase